MEKTIEQIIWFCGFYEGEGYVSNDVSNGNRIVLGIDQNDPAPLHEGQKIWGGSVRKRVRKSPVSEKICTCFVWKMSHTNAVIFINDIKPYMKIPYKINQIKTALQKTKTKPTIRYKCKFCDKTYANPSGRRRHEKKEHLNPDASESKDLRHYQNAGTS